MRRCRLLAAACLGLWLGGAPPAKADGTSVSVRSLPVPSETILPGEIITVDRLTERKFQTTAQSVAGIATSRDEVVGRETRRRLLAGKPIMLAGLGVPVLVRRGTSAVAFYREEGFSISTPVIALSDGSEGDMIDARATETGAVIKVQVLAGGELVVLGE